MHLGDIIVHGMAVNLQGAAVAVAKLIVLPIPCHINLTGCIFAFDGYCNKEGPSSADMPPILCQQGWLLQETAQQGAAGCSSAMPQFSAMLAGP